MLQERMIGYRSAAQERRLQSAGQSTQYQKGVELHVWVAWRCIGQLGLSNADWAHLRLQQLSSWIGIRCSCPSFVWPVRFNSLSATSAVFGDFVIVRRCCKGPILLH